MCCFLLHFSDFIVLSFKKNKKTCCSLLLQKTIVVRKGEKRTCREEKSQAPLDIKWSVP